MLPDVADGTCSPSEEGSYALHIEALRNGLLIFPALLYFELNSAILCFMVFLAYDPRPRKRTTAKSLFCEFDLSFSFHTC